MKFLDSVGLRRLWMNIVSFVEGKRFVKDNDAETIIIKCGSATENTQQN